MSGIIVWLTGLSGSGKTTIARSLKEALNSNNTVYILDGDNLRSGLNNDLKFSHEDRNENIRRVSEVATIIARENVIVVVATISPYEISRENARNTAKGIDFIEVYLDVPISVCERRDPKGLYKRAKNGEIPNFTGIDDVYEQPTSPDIKLDTEKLSIKECIDIIIDSMQVHVPADVGSQEKTFSLER